MIHDRWKAAIAVLVMAAAVAGARFLFQAATSPKPLLRLPGLDQSIPAPSAPEKKPVVDPVQKPQG